MICPLRGSAVRGEFQPDPTECIKENCALWDEELDLPCFKAFLYYMKKLSALKVSGLINTHPA